MKTIPTIHQWTNEGDKVLIVKLLNRDGTSHGGFKWPQSGPVDPVTWSRTPDCNSGGLFGWAWGLHIGEGKDPDACAEWVVFAARPENVIVVDGGTKVKAVPGEDGELPEVVYRGTQAGAMAFTLVGRIAWIQARSEGSSSATGECGSSSATGTRGSSSATGYCGSSSATGGRNVASVTGEEATIEVDTDGIAAARCDRVKWKVRAGAVLIQRFEKNGAFPVAVFDSKKLKLKTGDEVLVQLGKIVKKFTY